jgi:acetolactate decarboxylase
MEKVLHRITPLKSQARVAWWGDESQMQVKSKPAAAMLLVIVVLFSLVWVNSAWNSAPVSPTAEQTGTLFQVSQFNTFSKGNYEGNVTYAELAKHGDFGIGTVNGLDGEMIALDGVFYQIPVEGTPRQISAAAQTPYATITFFETDQTIHLPDSLNYSQLTAYINSSLPAYNTIYAIKVHGTFDYAKARSVPLQTRPYPPLADAVANQTVFTLGNVSGTAVGFWFPSSMDGVDFAGYHLHFITDNLSAGGHLLDCTAQNATLEIDQIGKFEMLMPGNVNPP